MGYDIFTHFLFDDFADPYLLVELLFQFVSTCICIAHSEELLLSLKTRYILCCGPGEIV